ACMMLRADSLKTPWRPGAQGRATRASVRARFSCRRTRCTALGAGRASTAFRAWIALGISSDKAARKCIVAPGDRIPTHNFFAAVPYAKSISLADALLSHDRHERAEKCK